MRLYRQSIIVFGIVLPIVITAAVVGALFLVKSKMAESFETKLATHKMYEMGRVAGREIENQVSRQKPHMDRWLSQISQETASEVTTKVREICERLPSKEIQQTAFDRSEKGGFGAVAAQDSSQVRIAFRGTFRTMQRAFLELETRMPQLQLQELQMAPSTNQSSLLNFQVTYTAWEK